MSANFTPLRYPGGKSRLTNFMKLVLRENSIFNGVYAEPYAGGCGVALGLLLDNAVDEIIINDIDPTVYAFWYSVLNNTDELCDRIANAQLNMDEWHRQKEIFSEVDKSDLLALGFSFFYLNRTNRSGILKAGVIGGKDQTGKWKIDARFPKEKLIDKLYAIAERSSQIKLFNLDARVLLKRELSQLGANSLVYIDPPYFHKGKQLYLNSYKPDDHALLSHSIKTKLTGHWIVSYDNTPEISDLYTEFKQETHLLNYTAANRYHGSEIIIYSDGLKLPKVDNPFKLPSEEYQKALKKIA